MMSGHKIVVHLLKVGVFGVAFAYSLPLFADFDNATGKINVTNSLIRRIDGVENDIRINKERADFEGAIKRVKDKIAKAHKSKVFPRQCFLYSGAFKLNGYEFVVTTNQIGGVERTAAEGVNDQNIQVDGQGDLRIDITQAGGGDWDVCLRTNNRYEDAMEIAISSFFLISSMTEEMIAESITVNPDKVGDVCLFWRQESCQHTFMVFIKGTCVAVIRGNADVTPVAALLERILCECEQAYEKGEIISIATAAERLSKKRNDEVPRSAAAQGESDGSVK